MSIVSFEILKGMTGFRDIEFLMEKACREAIDIHPNFSPEIRKYKYSPRNNNAYHRLYEGGNVVKVFLNTRICGNFELASRWKKNYDTLLYLNTFKIVEEDGIIELIPDERWQIRVDKKINDDCHEKIYVFENKAPKPKKGMMIKKYFFPAVLSIGGLYVSKKLFWDGNLSNYLTDSIENTFHRTSKALNVF